MKEVEITKGVLYLESTGEVIQKDTRLTFDKQTLLFKPSGETGEAYMKLLVESDKGGEAVASIFLTIKPIDFKVSALLKEASQEGKKLTQDDVALLEIMLSDIDPTLMEAPWKLSSWRCSDGMIRDILNEQGEELSAYPLSSKDKNRLYITLNDLSLNTPHSLILAIEGPGKITKEVNLPFLSVLKNLIESKAQALFASSEQKNKKAKEYLDIPAKASNYEAIKEAQEKLEKGIDKLTEIITSIESNYGQATAMPSRAANHLKKAQRNIASLEKKKNKLDKLKLKSSKERASFKVTLEAASKSIYAHGESVIDMHISSDSPLSDKLAYQVKDIAVSKGKLVLEKNHEVVKAGTELNFGTQKLIFKPSGEIGEAVISLTVTNEKGTESSTTLNLDVKAVSFQVALEANAKSMFAHQGAEVELVISSDEKEAENLVYSIKEVQGSLSLKSTGEKLSPGTKLHYGPQTLLFKPAIDPKVISEYQALLDEKKSLSLTQGNKKDAAEGAGEVVAINTRIEDLKLVIQSSKELVVKPLGNIEANLSLSVTSQEGGEDKSLVVLDVKPVGFQLGATAREAKEDERTLIAGDFIVLELELSQIDSSIEKKGWRLSSFEFNNEIDATGVTDTNSKTNAVIVDEQLREMPSYELKADGKNIFYLKLDNVDIHEFFKLILTVEGPSEAKRSMTLSLASAYQNLVQEQIAKQISVIQAEKEKIITFLQKAEVEEYEQLLSIKGGAEKKIEYFNKKYDDEVDQSSLISSYQDEEALKASVIEAIEGFKASVEKLNSEEKAWQAIAPLGNVKELAGYMNNPNKADNYLIHTWAEKEPIDTEAGKFILERTSDINCVNKNGKTALQLAIDKGNVDKVNLLLKHKADVNVKFADGKSPLLYTLEKEQQGKHALTEALLKAGANPNTALDSKGLMPLHVALQNKDLDKVTLLLKYKASPNSKFSSGETPLAYVIQHTTSVQREKLMHVLIYHQADQNSLEVNKFLSAIEQLSKDINDYLAKEVKERNYDRLKLLRKQAKGQSDHFNKTLGSVESGPKILGGSLKKEISDDLNKMIDKAIPSLRKELAKAEEEYNAWHEAIKSTFGAKTEQEIEKYIQHIYTADKDGNFLIHLWAGVESGNQQAGEFILQRTFDINAKNIQGNTPLHLAIQTDSDGKKDLTKTLQLLKYKADPNIKYPDGAYPLFTGLRSMDYWGYRLVAALLEHNSWANMEDSSDFPGWTPLLVAIRYDSPYQAEKVETLLKHGASAFKAMSRGRFSLYYEDYSGWTPLHAAAELGKTEIIKLLLANGAKDYRRCPARVYNNGYSQELIPAHVLERVPANAKSEIWYLLTR